MPVKPSEQRENLQYVRDMLEQLKVVSGAGDGSTLGYLMDMARLEAEHQLGASRETSKKQ